jgi:hypothetical protein
MTTSEIIILLLPAIAQVESADGKYIYGKNGEIGPLQIKTIVVDDLNRIHGQPIYTYQDRFNRAMSERMFKDYVTHYGTEKRLGHKPTAEDFARIWNFGPNGYKNEASRKYWAKVEKVLTAK